MGTTHPAPACWRLRGGWKKYCLLQCWACLAGCYPGNCPLMASAPFWGVSSFSVEIAAEHTYRERAPRPPWLALPRLGLTAMKSAEEASLSMSLSSELSDSSLLSARGQRRGRQDRRPLSQPSALSQIRTSEGPTHLSSASSPAAWAPSSPPPPPCPPQAAFPPHSLRCSHSAHPRPWGPPPAGWPWACLPAHPGSCCKTESGQRVSEHVRRPAQGLTPASRLPHLEPSDM